LQLWFIFAYIWFAMAMPFAPWKLWIAYLNSPIPKTLSHMQKMSLPYILV